MSLPAAMQSLRFGLRARRHSATTLPVFPVASTQQLQLRPQRCCRLAHTVRVILTEDLPNGKSYKGEVLHVKAGFARNHLIPEKFALYATPENFQKLDMKDPDQETEEQRAERLAREAMSDEGAEELKAADILKHYLRNKVLKIYRKVNPENMALFPGMVDEAAIRKKLSKQLKIDLDPHETIHIREEVLEPEELSSDQTLVEIIEALDTSKKCEVEIRKLGNFVARISLAGGYVVPLKFTVIRT